MHTISRSRGLAAGVASLACVALAACSSSGGSGSTDGSAGGSTGSTAISSSSAPAAAYSGPEASLPTSYGVPTPKAGYKFTLGWLEATGANAFVAGVAAAGKAEAAKLGGRTIILDAQLNADTQVSQCNQLVAQHVNAIAINSVDPNALEPCLKAAVAQGIKIVGEDTNPVAGTPLLPNFLSSVQQGADQAEFDIAGLAAQQSPGAEVAVLAIAIPVPLLQYGAQEVIKWVKADGLKYDGRVDSTADTADAAATAMNTILQKYPNVKVVMAYNDPAALAALQAARGAGRTDVKVYGDTGESSAIQSVAAGGLSGTVKLDVDQIGTQQVYAIYDALTNQNLPLPAQVVVKPILVTKANASTIKPIN